MDEEKLMQGQIILEDRTQKTFFLKEEEVKKLQSAVNRHNEWLINEGYMGNYSLVDEIRYGIKAYIEMLPNPGERQKRDRQP